MELRAALAADRPAELRTMPHGAGSGFRTERLPPGARGVFFAVRLLLGARPPDERAWRSVDLADPDHPIHDELEILQPSGARPAPSRGPRLHLPPL